MRIQAEGQITRWFRSQEQYQRRQASRQIEAKAWRNIHAEVTDYINKELQALDVVEATTDLPMVAAMVGLKHKIDEDLMQLENDQIQEEEESFRPSLSRELSGEEGIGGGFMDGGAGRSFSKRT